MSKILLNLKAAERLRREATEREGRELASDTSLAAEREAETVALAQAGADEWARREAEEQRRVDAELLVAIQRRMAAEQLAIDQARVRSEAEAQAETAAAERAHAERMLEKVAKARVEAEERALADASRRECAAADLAAAAAGRAQREHQAEALARERAASERRAAELAVERTKSEQSAEAAAVARRAAERDATEQASRRAIQEAAATAAAAARDRAESGGADETPIKVRLPDKPALPTGTGPVRRLLGAHVLGWLTAVVVGVALGWGFAHTGSARHPSTPFLENRSSGSLANRLTNPLRLEYELKDRNPGRRVIPRDRSH